MKLSESLRRGIMETSVGGIINKFKIRRRRRDIMIFGEVLSGYLKILESKIGQGEIMKISRRWIYLSLGYFMPSFIKKMPPMLLVNSIGSSVWKNLGLLTHFHAEMKGDVVFIETENEGITELIGENSFLPGLYIAVLEVVLGKSCKLLERKQSKSKCSYKFGVSDRKAVLPKPGDNKRYAEFNKLPPSSGYSLKELLRAGTLKMSDNNKIYFRGGIVYPMENTLFHIFEDKMLYRKVLEDLSYKYFSRNVDRSSTTDSMLKLLKNLLQTMGWGVIKIEKNGDELKINIFHPPHGLQETENRWDFLSCMILGYLRLLGSPSLVSIKNSSKYLILSYSLRNGHQ